MRWHWIAAVLAACLIGGATGCARAPEPAWRRTELPTGFRPSSLAEVDGRLLVGGQHAGSAAPGLLLVDPDGVVTQLALQPGQGYAQVAELVAVSPSEAAVVALGVARGGAHGNERWTSWEGPLAGPVREQPQDFWTFGGHEAGPLLGVVRPDGRTVIVGSRAGEFGFDAAWWTADATTWRRQPSGLGPRSTPEQALIVRAAAASGGSIVIVGAGIDLAGQVRQSPLLWVGSVDGPWQTVPLTVPGELSDATGLAQASAVACHLAVCWAGGWVHGRPVVWEVDVNAATVRPVVLAGERDAGADPVVALGFVAGSPVAFPNGLDAGFAWRCRGEWVTAAGPAGLVSAVAGVGSRIYAVTEDADGRSLWQRDLDPLDC